MSAFQRLYGSGCEQSLITLTGFDHAAIRYLLAGFEPLFDTLSPYSSDGDIIRLRQAQARPGWPRLMTAMQYSALTLSWGRSRGPTTFLSMVFGVMHSVMALFIRFGRRLLIMVLRDDSNARVAPPSEAAVRMYE
jgi:hypothetical protein